MAITYIDRAKGAAALAEWPTSLRTMESTEGRS
jgi:hypothetical protein